MPEIPCRRLLLTAVLALAPQTGLHAQGGAALDVVTQMPAGSPDGPGSGVLQLRSEGGTHLAPTLDTDVEIRIFGRVARTRVVQRFRNPEDVVVHGTYLFPLPEGAAVDTLQLVLGDRVIVGEIQERSRARATYRRARDSGRRASLLEQQRPNLFTTRVANIAPGEEIEVWIEYQETPRYESGRFGLRFPMVVTPRYDPSGDPPPVTEAPSASAEEARLPTARVHVTLDATYELDWMDSPSHAIEAERTDSGYRAVLERTPANADFVLHWAPLVGDVAEVSAVSEQLGGSHYAQLLLLPPDGPEVASRPRQTTFVLDTSGSMAGASIRQAKIALRRAIEALHPDDTFNLLVFSSRARALFERPVPADAERLDRAKRFVDSLEADGGTEIAAALELAFSQPEDAERLGQIVFVTDGAVTNEEELLGMIDRRLRDRRLFTIGIGSAPNGYFMRRAAEFGRGSCTFIGDLEQVEAAMEEMLAKIEAPVLTDLELDAPAGVDVWPRRLPDLYVGEPLVIALRHDGEQPLELTVRGRVGDRAVSFDATPDAARRHPGVGKLWARAKLRSLQDSLSRGADPELVRSEATSTALAHRLVSRYTSLVAVERTPAADASSTARDGEVARHAPRGSDAGVLPTGSTPSSRLALVGVLLIVAARLSRRLLR